MNYNNVANFQVVNGDNDGSSQHNIAEIMPIFFVCVL